MSAKSRLKYQAQKHNFKPQIPDSSESEEDSFAESLDSFIDSTESETEEISPPIPVYERKPTLPFAEPESEPVIESESEISEADDLAQKVSFLDNFLSLFSLSALVAFGCKIGSFAYVPFRLVRRFSSAAFKKIQSFQKSYVESITAEGPRESLENHAEISVETNEEQADSFSAAQIEATTRQLTELHKKPSASSEEKREKSSQVQTVLHLEDEAYEETEGDEPENLADAFDEDDFDEAVRRARMKLITSAALVFLCIGGFFGYQFFSTRWSKQDTVASEEQNANGKREEQDNPKVIDEPPPAPVAKTTTQQLAEMEPIQTPSAPVNPLVASQITMPLESAFDEIPQDSSDSFAETVEPIGEPDLLSPGLDSVPVDDFGAIASAQQMEVSLDTETESIAPLSIPNEAADAEAPAFDSIAELAESDNDIPDFEPSLDLLDEEPALQEPPQTTFLAENSAAVSEPTGMGLTKSTLSLSPAQRVEGPNVTAIPEPEPQLQANAEQKLQGEMQGTQISLAPSAVGNLPLPQNRSLAVGTRAVPAAPIADQFQEEELAIPFSPGPVLASPNKRYEMDAQMDPQMNIQPNSQLISPATDESVLPSSALPRIAGNTRRQASLPFDASRSVAQNQTQNQIQLQPPTQMQLQASTVAEQLDLEQSDWTPRKIEYRQYTVQEGDNLFNIAKRELGNVGRWKEVYQLNKDSLGQDAAYLTPGAEIFLPE